MAAVVGTALYLAPSVAVSRSVVEWNLERSHAVRNLVLGVGRAQQLHAGKVIVLSELAPDLFWSAMRDDAFSLVGAQEVYLTPAAGTSIASRPELADINEFILPSGPLLKALTERRAVVYSAARPVLRNITTVYTARNGPTSAYQPARRVDVGNSLFAEQIGTGWYPIERGYRWMRRMATVRLGGPPTRDARLHITGYCSADQLKDGPVRLSVFIEDRPVGAVDLVRGDARFDADFALADGLVGKSVIEARLSVNRTFISPGEGRELGAAFGVLAIR
jgi:hypothetical protein